MEFELRLAYFYGYHLMKAMTNFTEDASDHIPRFGSSALILTFLGCSLLFMTARLITQRNPPPKKSDWFNLKQELKKDLLIKQSFLNKRKVNKDLCEEIAAKRNYISKMI